MIKYVNLYAYWPEGHQFASRALSLGALQLVKYLAGYPVAVYVDVVCRALVRIGLRWVKCAFYVVLPSVCFLTFDVVHSVTVIGWLDCTSEPEGASTVCSSAWFTTCGQTQGPVRVTRWLSRSAGDVSTIRLLCIDESDPNLQWIYPDLRRWSSGPKSAEFSMENSKFVNMCSSSSSSSFFFTPVRFVLLTIFIDSLFYLFCLLLLFFDSLLHLMYFNLSIFR